MTVLAGFERIIPAYPDASLTRCSGRTSSCRRFGPRLSQSAPLAHSVRLVGQVPHDKLPAYYSAADIFVLGSRYEGSGYALIEACACGAIPVVTGIPTFRVITGDGARGALWTPGDMPASRIGLSKWPAAISGALRADLAVHFARALSWTAVGRRAPTTSTQRRARGAEDSSR